MRSREDKKHPAGRKWLVAPKLFLRLSLFSGVLDQCPRWPAGGSVLLGLGVTRLWVSPRARLGAPLGQGGVSHRLLPPRRCDEHRPHAGYRSRFWSPPPRASGLVLVPLLGPASVTGPCVQLRGMVEGGGSERSLSVRCLSTCPVSSPPHCRRRPLGVPGCASQEGARRREVSFLCQRAL